MLRQGDKLLTATLSGRSTSLSCGCRLVSTYVSTLEEGSDRGFDIAARRGEEKSEREKHEEAAREVSPCRA